MTDRQDIKRQVLAYLEGSDHPDLVVYRRDFGDKFDIDHWLDGRESAIDLAGFRGKDVLEVGCGFGWDAVALALIGGNRVTATDILPSMIDGVTECLASAAARGDKIAVTAKVADICDNDMTDASFDGIFSSEAIEHVRDLPRMFSEVRRLLRPGGRLMIINDANRYNTAFREATLEMWAERDGSWDHADWLRKEVRPVEHADAKPYAAMREAILTAIEPPLDPVQIAALVPATAGMIRPEIASAAQAYRAGGPLPVRPEFAWCRNPETGEYAERLLDPFELRDGLKAAGLRNVRLRHGFNRFPFRLANGIGIRAINEWLFDRRPVFILLADR